MLRSKMKRYRGVFTGKQKVPKKRLWEIKKNQAMQCDEEARLSHGQACHSQESSVGDQHVVEEHGHI